MGRTGNQIEGDREYMCIASIYSVEAPLAYLWLDSYVSRLTSYLMRLLATSASWDFPGLKSRENGSLWLAEKGLRWEYPSRRVDSLSLLPYPISPVVLGSSDSESPHFVASWVRELASCGLSWQVSHQAYDLNSNSSRANKAFTSIQKIKYMCNTLKTDHANSKINKKHNKKKST